MSIEFISAKDLPISEAEEVDVLCVENGELKRKAGANFGGSAYDAKIKVWFDANDEEFKCELVEGSFNDLYEKINNEIVTNVIIAVDTTASENYRKYVAICQPQYDGVCILLHDSISGGYFLIDRNNNAEFG